VEFSSAGFAFFFIGEYLNLILMSSLCTIYFFGGALPPPQWMITLLGVIIFPQILIIYFIGWVYLSSFLFLTFYSELVRTIWEFFYPYPVQFLRFCVQHWDSLFYTFLYDSSLYIEEFLLFNRRLTFTLKVDLILMLFIFARASLPRYRYDQVMSFFWKTLLPAAFGNLFITAGIIILFS